MTEKRFKLVDIGFVYDNDELIGMEEIVDLLNELDEKYVDEFSLRETLQQELQRVEKENEELKEINCNLKDFRNFITEQNVLNEKQRKELQLQLLRLYNFFENYFADTMSPNAFSEMWDNVKEDEKWEEKIGVVE